MRRNGVKGIIKDDFGEHGLQYHQNCPGHEIELEFYSVSIVEPLQVFKKNTNWSNLYFRKINLTRHCEEWVMWGQDKI